MSQTGILDGCDSNGSVLWGSAVNPRREQGQHVSVVALTIKFKKKRGGSVGQEQTLGTFRRPWQPQRKCQTSSSSSSQISFSDPPAEERLSDFTPLSGRFYFTACEASRTFNEEAA